MWSGAHAALREYIKRQIVRLPPAAGAVTGDSPPLAGSSSLPVLVHLLGESTAAGVGVPTHEHGLAGHLSRELSARTGRPVRWHVAARSGATVRQGALELVPQLRPASGDVASAPELVVLLFGVNDLVRMTTQRSLSKDVSLLVEAVRKRLGPVPVLLAGVPPVHRFPAMPAALRPLLAWRVRVLDRALADLAPALGVGHDPAPVLPPDRELFASDGFHPSEQLYALWARRLAEALLEQELARPILP